MIGSGPSFLDYLQNEHGPEVPECIKNNNIMDTEQDIFVSHMSVFQLLK